MPVDNAWQAMDLFSILPSFLKSDINRMCTQEIIWKIKSTDIIYPAHICYLILYLDFCIKFCDLEWKQQVTLDLIVIIYCFFCLQLLTVNFCRETQNHFLFLTHKRFFPPVMLIILCWVTFASVAWFYDLKTVLWLTENSGNDFLLPNANCLGPKHNASSSLYMSC